MIHVRTLLLACLVLVALARAAGAQDLGANPGKPSDYVTWTATAMPATATQGDTVQVRLEAEIGEGWKMYALNSPKPTRALQVDFLNLPQGLQVVGDFRQAGEKEAFDPFFNKDVVYFTDRAVIEAKIAVTDEAVLGAQTLGGTVNYQICNDSFCFPPTYADVAAALEVRYGQSGSEGSSGAAVNVPEPSSPPENESPSFTGEEGAVLDMTPEEQPDAEATIAPASDFDAAQSGGLWSFLLLAVGAGLAALLTPCVFPMIPLTVSYFTKHADDPGEAVRMAVVYGLAIVLTFTGLGVLMAVLVGAAGAQSFATNPWVNLLIGVIFVIFALSLLGLFELRLPSGLVNYFNRKSTESRGYSGVLFMGLTLTVVSFSCTAPFVGGLLAATTQGAWSYPVLGMIVFSATFSLPFMFFAMFPRALSSLPKSGAWMSAVKVVLGFVELAAALKFLSNADLVWGWGLISRTLAIALSVVIFFLAGLYLIGKLRLEHEPAVERIGVGRLLFAIGFFGLSLYMLPGLLGAPLNKLDAYLPPRQLDDVGLTALFSGQLGALDNEENWIVDDVDQAFQEAEASGKPVLIDFTGYTCTNCREMEANVFTKQAIAERFERDFVLLRLYTDGPRDRELQKFQLELTGTVALPTYAIVSPEDPDQPLVKVSGVVPVDAFAAFLAQGTASFAERDLAATR